MFITHGLPSQFIPILLCLLFPTEPSFGYTLRNCTILYKESPSSDVYFDCAYQEQVTIPTSIPKDAVSVQLSNNLIQKINKEDLSEMSKLRILNLGHNQISSVEDGSFNDLVSLETLNMGDNKLVNLEANMFQGLSNLTVLDLSNNYIEFIHNSSFQFLTRLQTLDLENNFIGQVIYIQPILQLPQLQILNLNGYQNLTFETKDLTLNFSSSLKEFAISGCNLKMFSITTPVFPYLEKINLSAAGQYDVLKWNIPDKTILRHVNTLFLVEPVLSFKGVHKVLKSFQSLRYLRLQFLHEWIRDGLLSAVCKIPTLRKLDIFSILHGSTSKLAPCSQLTELDLFFTEIDELSEGSVRSMRQLRSLNVSTNQLSKVPYDIRSLSSLQILKLDNNIISDLNCDDFLNTTQLTELYLHSNRIGKLERCVLENLNELKLLNLSNNQLKAVGETFQFSLFNLEILDISDNKVFYIDYGYFQALGNLKVLNVVRDRMGRVKHRSFQELKNLETLNVSLSHFEATFRGLNHLENMTIHLFAGDKNLQSNGNTFFFSITSLKTLSIICKGHEYPSFCSLPVRMLKTMKYLQSFRAVNVNLKDPNNDTFKFNKHLESLALTMTDLSNLDSDLFHPIPHLKTLDLSETNIKSLDFLKLANLSALRYLKMTGNDINVIDDAVFQFLPSLTYLNLSNNPFTCDCSNIGFIQWLKNNKQTQVVNAHQYKCSYPLNKQGNLLLDFDIQSCWKDFSFVYFISSTSLVVLTLLTSFIYNFLRWHLIYTFHLFLAYLYENKKKKQNNHNFDAFVSYNIHDEHWVYRELLPVLEEEQGWKLCLHHRDFQPGKPIIENITDAIYGSRKTICVISRNYLQSEWCSREIQMASFRLFDEKKDVLILLFLEDIPPHHLSPFYRMRKLVKERTYLSWPQAAQHPGVFWQNVRRALQAGDAVTENTDLLTGPEGHRDI
ncbi:PREDICTED: toll-like receptor 13 [Cyprinodon variegatus]|nr:PREDICTED: toll-like receptor 13 [Cyprinodon variegatus]